jgi:hypothetical protein
MNTSCGGSGTPTRACGARELRTARTDYASAWLPAALILIPVRAVSVRRRRDTLDDSETSPSPVVLSMYFSSGSESNRLKWSAGPIKPNRARGSHDRRRAALAGLVPIAAGHWPRAFSVRRWSPRTRVRGKTSVRRCATCASYARIGVGSIFVKHSSSEPVFCVSPTDKTCSSHFHSTRRAARTYVTPIRSTRITHSVTAPS